MKSWMPAIISLVIAFMLGACSGAANNEAPAKRKALATETAQLFLSAGGYNAIVEQSVDAASKEFAATMRSILGRELTQTEYEQTQGAFLEAYRKTFPDNIWEPDLADMYARHFSTTELEQLLQFYRTPTGLKFLAKQDQLVNEGTRIGARLYESKSEEFFRAFWLELEKRRKQP